jgi:hypothetical protein
MRLGQMMFGFWISQGVSVSAKLGLGDLLKDGPRTAEELAAKTQTHAPSLYRLLRMLASVGVFLEDQDRRFSLTEVGQYLRSDIEGSQRAMAIMSGEEHFRAWCDLLFSVQTGLPAFDHVFGMPVFDWLSGHPEQAAVFDAAMVSVHGRETAAILDAYDFSGIHTLADIGGGNGSVLIATLQKHPQLQGMLFDLPGVITRANSHVQATGLADRCQLISGSFFESIPAGADAYLMRHIIHDWNEAQCLTILRNIRAVLPKTGRLLVAESVIPPGNDPFFGKLLDMNMLVVPGGKERTADEYRTLLQQAGFDLARIVPTSSELSIIEARPA